MGEIKEIKSVPVVPFALITGAIFAVLTFIWTILIAILGISTLSYLPIENTGNAGVVGALILVIGGTIIAFIVGFIMYAILAIFYNLLAPKLGGIKLELE